MDTCGKQSSRPPSLQLSHDRLLLPVVKNGAGKTTAVSILTGLTRASGGDGYISGFDIATEMRAVHQHIGVCPQVSVAISNRTRCSMGLSSCRAVHTEGDVDVWCVS
jgi:ABC-type Na+ transport system ATPase subunit NatA